MDDDFIERIAHSSKEMKVICCIDWENTIRAYQLMSTSKDFRYKWYYNWTMHYDKLVIVKHYKYYVIDNSKMYEGIYFKDILNLEDHQEFSTEEEALMYATSCV